MESKPAHRLPQGGTEPPLLCSVDLDATRSVVRLCGELDAESAAVLLAVVEGQIARGNVDLRLDLSGLLFCDLRGLDALLAVRCRLRESGGRLLADRPSAFLRRIADICGAGDLFDGPG